MRDDALVRFTAHEIPREDLHAFMIRITLKQPLFQFFRQ